MSFALEELQGILNEQKTFDLILSFNILPTTSADSASATVHTLEDRQLVIKLTQSGYTLANDSQVYETIEGLLSTVSPLYREKTAEVLHGKLEALLQSRLQAGDEDEN